MKLYIKELYKELCKERFIVEEIKIDKYKYFVVKDTKFNKYYSGGDKFTSKIEDKYYFMFYENALTKSKILSNTEI